MKSLKNIGPLGWVIILGLIATVSYFTWSHFKKNGTIGKAVSSAVASKIGSISKDADLVVAYNTFPGMEGLILMNEGMEPNTESKLYKEYGIKVQIKQMDVESDTREGLKAGVLDLAYCTIDALSIGMGSGSALLESDVKVIMKVNESRGADAIVVTSGITKVSELKGKKIAFAVGTASNTLLINMLETSGLSMSDITAYKVGDGVEAAAAFKNGQCDAAVVWAPDDEDCVSAVKGSSILVTTKTASQIIADGLLVKAAVLESKRANITKLIKAWLEGNGTINSSPQAKVEANRLFAKGFKFDEAVAAKSSDKIRFSTLTDNKAFFGLDAMYTGVTGEKMYGRMAVKYTEAGLAKAPASWLQVSDASVIKSLLTDDAFASSAAQGNEAPVVFKAPTEKEKTVEAKGSKVVSITFPTGQWYLDEQSKTLIDREVTNIAQAFATAKVRVEGNTDNVGNPNSNRDLSFKRANSVVNYLISEHHFSPNKFIVLGNGQNKPVPGCEANQDEDCKQRNRRTDFEFIW